MTSAYNASRRHASTRLGPLSVRWEEGFGEWSENRQWTIVREFQSGPLRRMEVVTELFPEGEGTRLLFTVAAETSGVIGLIARVSGMLDRECARILKAIEQLVRQPDGAGDRERIAAAALVRLNTLAAGTYG